MVDKSNIIICLKYCQPLFLLFLIIFLTFLLKSKIYEYYNYYISNCSIYYERYSFCAVRTSYDLSATNWYTVPHSI